MRIFFVFLACIIGICFAQQTQKPNEAEWILRLDQDGVLIFTRPMPDNPVDEFMALTLIDGNIDSAFAMIADPVRFLSMDPLTARAELLNQVDSAECYVWYEVKMPSIFKPREIVSRIHTSKTSKGYMIVAECDPTYIPPRDGYIRIQKGNYLVGLRTTGPNQFELMYRGYLAPTMKMTVRYANKVLVPSTFERIDGVRKHLKQKLQ